MEQELNHIHQKIKKAYKMTQTTARIKQAGKHFEIKVDLDEALKFKKGETSSIEAEGDKIFTDSKKGMVASTSDLEMAFGTTDISSVVEKINQGSSDFASHSRLMTTFTAR